MKKSAEHSMKQSMKRAIEQSEEQPIKRSEKQSMKQSVKRAIEQLGAKGPEAKDPDVKEQIIKKSVKRSMKKLVAEDTEFNAVSLKIRLAEIDGLLSIMRSSSRDSQVYAVAGQRVMVAIFRDIFPWVKTAQDTKEIYYLRLRSNGHEGVINLCEEKILAVLKSSSPDELNYEKIKNLPWVKYLYEGSPIFKSDILKKIDGILGINKFVFGPGPKVI